LYVQKEVKAWKYQSYTSLILLLTVVIGLVYCTIFYYDLITYLNKDVLGDFKFWLLTLIFASWLSFAFKRIYDTHYNHSNIENYKKSIEFPKELR